MQSARDLDVYKLMFDVTIKIYKVTETFPKSETFGLSSQMRRAAISVNANLTEGSSRISTAEYRRFAGIARGSASELKYHIEIAAALGFINQEVLENLLDDMDRVCRMLTGLIKKLSTPTRITDTDTNNE